MQEQATLPSGHASEHMYGTTSEANGPPETSLMPSRVIRGKNLLRLLHMTGG